MKVLAVHSSEKTDAKCAFCDKSGHAIHKCWRFTDTNVSERIKFVQMSVMFWLFEAWSSLKKL